MKLHQLIHQVYFEPSLITAEAHASIRQLLESPVILEAFQSRDPGKNICGAKVEVDQMRIIDGIAHIPVGGVIGINLTPFDRGSGAVDVNDLTREIEEAEASKDVKALLLEFDSPGGMVNGTPELATKIAGVQKPIFAFTNGLMCSAAYWLGAATDGIMATQTANIGSIGVYLAYADVTRALEMEGVKIELFKSGRYKGMGYPGTPLSDDHRAHLQARTDEIFQMFKSHVLSHRPSISDDSMQGQSFLAGNALKRGMIDTIVQSKRDAVALIR